MEGVDLILGLLLSSVDDDATKRYGLVVLGVDDLGDGNGGRDGHHGGGDERGSGNTELDVTSEDGTRNGRKTGGHGEVELGGGHEVDEGLDHAGRLSLTDEGRSGGDDGWEGGREVRTDGFPSLLF